MQPRRQHLVKTARQLFNEYGYHSVGIDRILAESGVSKATLYKHFSSKEELIMAVLTERHEEVVGGIREAIVQAEEAGKDPTLAIFDALHAWFNSKDFFGCNFINASAEYSGLGDPIYDIAAMHKQAVKDLILQSLRLNSSRASKRLADEIALLVDGAIARAHTAREKNAAKTAKSIAKQLIESAAKGDG